MVFVDEYGRPYNLSDVPMTYMTRSKSFKKQGFDEKKIDRLYKEDMGDKTSDYVYDKDGNVKRDTKGIPVKRINSYLTADIRDDQIDKLYKEDTT